MEFGFEKLVVWQKSRILVKEVYEVVKDFPIEEKYGLSDQLRRAVISVASNIAEGSSRLSVRDKINFCQMAYASLMEVAAQLVLAEDLGFIDKQRNQEVRVTIDEVERVLCGFYNFLKQQLS